jgi:hypothetical protein
MDEEFPFLYRYYGYKDDRSTFGSSKTFINPLEHEVNILKKFFKELKIDSNLQKEYPRHDWREYEIWFIKNILNNEDTYNSNNIIFAGIHICEYLTKLLKCH